MPATPTLAGFQRAFMQALFDRPDAEQSAHTELSGLTGQPAFAIYRNTVRKACIDALEANHPAVARLVGSEWFRAAAALHVEASPPRDGRLLHYGAGFADFLAAFEPAADLPYLPGVARLERFWTEAHAAADAPCADASLLARMAPDALGALLLRPHPAARWAWFEALPVFSIWSRNRPGAEPTDAALDWQAEGALFTRPDDEVVWHSVGPAEIAFLDACHSGQPLGMAAAAALAAQPDIDLAALLARLLQAGALTQTTPESSI
ncbi:MAG: DUF2063 domain-containing protein [Comamonadaceae bacterium]|nr:MAG: DUF2063 domain-containing protein [Comamonadaceae bacterium]